MPTVLPNGVYQIETRRYSQKRSRIWRESGAWGWVQFDAVQLVLDMDMADKDLIARWQRTTTNWVRRIIYTMQQDPAYKGDGIDKDWHREVRMDPGAVRGSFYNTNAFYKYVENDTRGAPRKFPPWKPGSRIWNWAERKGLLAFTTRRNIAQRVVFGIAKAVYEHGTVGKHHTERLVAERLPELAAALEQDSAEWALGIQ